MLMECWVEPGYVWEEFDHTIHRERDCHDVLFLKSNYYLLSLYHLHETDVSYTLVGNTLMDQMTESDATRLRIAQDFETEVFVPLVGLSFDDIVADGVPSHSYTMDPGLVDYAGLFVGLDAAVGAGLLPIAPQVYDDLASYLTGQIADYDAAGLIRQDVIAVLTDIIDDAKAAAATP